MTILIAGGAGQLGAALKRKLGENAVAADSQSLDITSSRQLDAMLGALQPRWVINCAAYTLVDQAERESQRCWEVNAAAVEYLVAACRRRQSGLVQISTDYVFDGQPDRTRPFLEEDAPTPRSVYARSKLEGERLAAQLPQHFIVRTCGLYGRSPRANNFVEKMLQLASTRKQLRVVDDQRCTPTYVEHLAEAVLFLLRTEAYGTYHVVNQGSTSWHGFAEEIFRLQGRDVQLEPITSEQFAAAAQRPRYSVLDTGKYQRLGGPPLPAWQQALAEYLDKGTGVFFRV